LCQPPYYGGDGSGGLELPATPTAQGSGTTGQGTAGSSPSPNKGTPESSGDGGAHESSACQMGHAPASTGAFSLMAMLGALLGLKRRRAQR